jgi:predicted nucleotide-binding protein (sugar kinase/HSP70/actin superfamily)
MKVTFPHLGSMYIFCKAIAETAGIDYVLPNPISDRTREIGEYSTNESVCLPLKIILGNMADALDRGADTIVMIGSGPPCRLGMYDRILKMVLQELGYSFRWLTIPGVFNRQAFLQNREETLELRKELTPANIIRFPLAVYVGWRKMIWCEHLEKKAMEARATAVKPAAVDILIREGLADLDRAKSLWKISRSGHRTLARLAGVERNNKTPLRVMMVGEVYTVMEPSINMDIERRLGHLGVLVERSSYFSTHIRKGSRLDRRLLKQRETFLDLAKPYLEYDVGAECNFSVAETIQAAQRGFDGVVHVYPFSCMPESTAAAVLAAAGQDCGIPVMPMVIDRQDMGLRIDTQLEAFVDVMKWRKWGRII